MHLLRLGELVLVRFPVLLKFLRRRLWHVLDELAQLLKLAVAFELGLDIRQQAGAVFLPVLAAAITLFIAVERLLDGRVVGHELATLRVLQQQHFVDQRIADLALKRGHRSVGRLAVIELGARGLREAGVEVLVRDHGFAHLGERRPDCGATRFDGKHGEHRRCQHPAQQNGRAAAASMGGGVIVHDMAPRGLKKNGATGAPKTSVRWGPTLCRPTLALLHVTGQAHRAAGVGNAQEG